ncbi:MAG: hypothetical protein U0132_02130 [Gemmatimonadaceae bacterium]
MPEANMAYMGIDPERGRGVPLQIPSSVFGSMEEAYTSSSFHLTRGESY